MKVYRVNRNRAGSRVRAPDSRTTDGSAATDHAAAAVARTVCPGAACRRPYTPPRLERLGAWRALTLQQSVPIGPGGY